MSKSKKSKTPKSNKTGQALKAALATTQANIARIEAQERGGKPKADGQAKPKGTKAAKAKAPKEKKAKRMSALDAAAKVLTESKEPLNAQAIIKVMADKGLWTSPKGKTPHATLYAAVIREIKERGRDSRFVKKDRGLFAATGKAV